MTWDRPLHKPGVVALRPLGVGDFFDGAFTTIRRNPAAMIGLAALVSLVFLVVPALITLALTVGGVLDGPTAGGLTSVGTSSDRLHLGTASLASYVALPFTLVSRVVLIGMLTRVVADAVLGRKTTIGQAWTATRGRLLPLLGLTLLDLFVSVVLVAIAVVVGVLVAFSVGMGAGIAIGVLLFLAALIVLVWVQITFFLLAAPALVLEGTGVLESIRRATALARQQFWRLLGIFLLTSLVVGIAGQVVGIPLTLLGALGARVVGGTGGTLILVFSNYLSQLLVGALLTPFTSAVTVLQYVDQRIRKEGLDVTLIAASQQTPQTFG